MSGRRFLVLAQPGDTSLRAGRLDGPRTFDLVVVPGGVGRVDPHREAKWPALAALLDQEPRYVEDYDAVWFPDPDVETDAATVSAVFALHAELGLGLSHPALTADSRYASSASLRHPGLAVRFTDAVEDTAPLFSRTALRACRPTFGQSRTGAGLGLVWPLLVEAARQRTAVLDCLPVRCTGEDGSSAPRGETEAGALDVVRLATRYGVVLPHVVRTAGGLDEDFRVLSGPALHRALVDPGPWPTRQVPSAGDDYARRLVGARPFHRPRPATEQEESW